MISNDRYIQVIDARGEAQTPTYLRRAKGLVKNGRAEWVNETTIRIFDLSIMPDKRIDGIVPASFSLEQPIPMVFPAMCACVDMQLKGSKANDETKRKNLTNTMSLCLTASGIGFLHAFDCAWLSDPAKPYAAVFSDILPSDDYIRYTMLFLGYNYRVIRNDGGNQDEMFSCIREAIDSGMPALAERAVGQYWNIIAGYKDTGALFGYYPRLAWLPAGQTISENTADGFLENGMFIKEDWYSCIEQIVVIESKNRQALSAGDFLPYWRSIMELRGGASLLCGFLAHDAMLSLLRDDAFWQNADFLHLERAYQMVRAMGCGLPECRAYTAGAIAHHFAKHCKAELPEGFWPFRRAVDQYFHDTHRQCWKVWRTSGDGLEYKEEFVAPFRDPGVRNQVLKLYEIIRQNDLHVYDALKNC